MSMQAKGLLCYLLSLPDDWVLFKSELRTRFSNGKDSINSAFQELIDFSYISVDDKAKNEGKFSGYNYTVSDYPQRFIRSGLSAAENPPLNNNISNNTNKTNTNRQNDDSEKSSSFSYKKIADFWLKKFHPGWTFSAAHGKQVNQIILKLTSSLKNASKEATDDAIIDSFIFICKHLPDYYRDKDLAIINSKYNEIISEIKSSKKIKPDAELIYTPPKHQVNHQQYENQ